MPTETSIRAKSHFTVLLTSPDCNVILVNALREAARSTDLELKIIACDQQARKSPASLLSDAAYQLPPRNDDDYLEAIIDVCVVHRVDLILPLAEADAVLLTRHRCRFDGIGVALALCGSSLILAAERWSRSDRKKAQFEGPHPGQHHAAQFRIVLYYDRTGRLHTIIPCQRLLADGAEHLITRRDQRVIAGIRARLGQIKTAQSIVTLEAAIDAHGELLVEHIRFDLADTVEIAHKAGAQLVRWLLQEHAGLNADPNDDWQEGVEMLRYSAAIYLLPGEDRRSKFVTA